MKRFGLSALLLAVLGFCSCAPQQMSQSAAQPISDGSTLTLITGLNYQTVTLQNGSRPAVSATVRLTGGPLRVNDKRCTADGADLVCTLGELPAGGKRTIYATGVMQATAHLGRADGSTTSLSSN